jgi:hypothetical protein
MSPYRHSSSRSPPWCGAAAGLTRILSAASVTCMTSCRRTTVACTPVSCGVRALPVHGPAGQHVRLGSELFAVLLYHQLRTGLCHFCRDRRSRERPSWWHHICCLRSGPFSRESLPYLDMGPLFGPPDQRSRRRVPGDRPGIPSRRGRHSRRGSPGRWCQSGRAGAVARSTAGPSAGSGPLRCCGRRASTGHSRSRRSSPRRARWPTGPWQDRRSEESRQGRARRSHRPG